MLRVRRLSLRYPNGKPRAGRRRPRGASRASLSWCLGGNGSGKTTLLRCIARTAAPDRRRGLARTAPISARLTARALRRARLELAMISQHAEPRAPAQRAGQRGDRRARPPLHLADRASAACRAASLRAARDYLARSRSCPSCRTARRHAVRRPGTAGRNRARAGAAAARAAGGRAGREPRSGGAEEIMRLLRAWRGQEKLAVLCVLHQVELAYGYADRVVGIRDGRVAFDLPRGESRATSVRRLYLTTRARVMRTKPHEHRMSATLRAPRCRSRPASPGCAERRSARSLRCAARHRHRRAVADRGRGAAAGPDHRHPRHGRSSSAAPCRRISPNCPTALWPTLETVDIALFGTSPASSLALPLAVLAAANVTPSRVALLRARAASSASPARCPIWSGRCYS